MFDGIIVKKKRIHYTEPSYKKVDSINELIKQDNCEIHIFRYPILYCIYNTLYLLTYKKPLANLNYYVEDDGSLYAEIKDSHKLYLPDRLKAHIDLLRKVKKKCGDLIYAESPQESITNENSQLSLFNLT